MMKIKAGKKKYAYGLGIGLILERIWNVESDETDIMIGAVILRLV